MRRADPPQSEGTLIEPGSETIRASVPKLEACETQMPRIP